MSKNRRNLLQGGRRVVGGNKCQEFSAFGSDAQLHEQGQVCCAPGGDISARRLTASLDTKGLLPAATRLRVRSLSPLPRPKEAPRRSMQAPRPRGSASQLFLALDGQRLGVARHSLHHNHGACRLLHLLSHFWGEEASLPSQVAHALLLPICKLLTCVRRWPTPVTTGTPSSTRSSRARQRRPWLPPPPGRTGL